MWKLPPPFSAYASSRGSGGGVGGGDERSVCGDVKVGDVHVKLADYGISRPTLPTGAKGFGGTEGFMAPEIIKYNGEEEYTEKVDCFSFGMFLYELLTLHQPFIGKIAQLRLHSVG